MILLRKSGRGPRLTLTGDCYDTEFLLESCIMWSTAPTISFNVSSFSHMSIEKTEAIFLVVCDPSMNEL
jgi:hypothetical protein